MIDLLIGLGLFAELISQDSLQRAPGLVSRDQRPQARNRVKSFFTKGVSLVRLERSPVCRMASAWVGYEMYI
jgi:hypothetical protein